MDRGQKPSLPGTPVARLPIKEGNVNPPIQLFFVERLKPVPPPEMIALEPRDGFIVILSLVGVAFLECAGDPFNDRLVQHQIAKHPRELCLQDFLPHIRLGALPLLQLSDTQFFS